MPYPIEKFDKQITIQYRLTNDDVRDAQGAIPYGWVDYLKGDGYGIYAFIEDPSAEDILEAARRNQETTHTIVTRYDKRIKPSMRVKYWNGDEYEYFPIKTVENKDFQNRFMIIHAKQETEEPRQ